MTKERTISLARFKFGKIILTTGAMTELEMDDIEKSIDRHLAGDWGEVGPEDAEMNERSIAQASLIFSSYTASNGVKFCIVTEADRSSTTVVLDYEI